MCFFVAISLTGGIISPAAAKAEVGDQLIYNGILYQKAEDGLAYAINYDTTTRDSDAELLSASWYRHPETESALVVGGVNDNVFENYSVSRIYFEMKGDFVIGKRAFADMYVGEITGSTITAFNAYFRSSQGGRIAEIGEEAFASTEVMGDVTFNTSIGAIGARAFQNIYIDGYFDMGKEIHTIGDYAFEGFQVGEGVAMPKIVYHIGNGAFANCKLTAMALPYTLESLGSKVFEGCEKLTKIRLPKSNTLQEVAKDAFPDKEGLTILVPIEVTDLTPYHFNEYENLTYQLSEEISEDSEVLSYLKENKLKYKLGEDGEVLVDGKPYAPETQGGTGENPEPTPTAPVTSENPEPTPTAPVTSENPEATPTAPVTSENPEATPTAPVTSEKPMMPPTSSAISEAPAPTEAVEKKLLSKGDLFQSGVGKYQVTGKNSVTFLAPVKNKEKKISIPGKVQYQNQSFKVTKIAPKAFQGRKSIKKVIIGNQVKIIGNQAFAKCNNLEEIIFGKKVMQLGKKVLFQNRKLKKITFRGKDLKKIGKKSFSGVPRKAAIVVPKSKIKEYQRLINQA